MTKEQLLNPSVGLLAKLGSIAGHVEEAHETDDPQAGALDLAAAKAVIEDQEVKSWLAGMRELALIPEPR